MKIIYAFAVASVLTACGSTKESTSTESTSSNSTSSLPAQIEPEEELLPEIGRYNPSETILTDLIHTKLQVNFNWDKSQLNGVATITCKPYFYATDSLILDAKSMEIEKVTMNGNPLNFAYTDKAFLRIKLDREYKRTENYTVEITYIAKPDEKEAGGSAAITSDKGLYFINPKKEEGGHMPQIWTQGETEASSVWFPTIDAPNQKMTQEILITVDKKFVTLSNGKLIKQTANTDGTRTDHWKQDLPHVPYLAMMGVGEFAEIKDTYKAPDGTIKEVNYYVEPEWKEYAKDIFGETPEMMRFFSDLTGVEYPWDKYSQIVVRDYVSGAMENTGAVIFGDFVYKTDRELLDSDDNSTIAHELFHHWFGDLVTCESWANLPLNESFANYSQYLWDEYRYGKDHADYYAEIEASGYYQTAETQGMHDMIWYDYINKEQMFDGHSYNKGGRILNMLRTYLGDEAFFEGIKTYLMENQYQPAELAHLRLAFEKVSGEDLNWFFNQWFLDKGHPVLDISQSMNADSTEVTVKIVQDQDFETTPLYILPIKIAVYTNGQMEVHDVEVNAVENEFTYAVNGKLDNIIVDADRALLAKRSEDKPYEQYVHQYYNGTKYADRKEAMIYGSKLKSEDAQNMILAGLSDPFWNIRLMAIKKSKKLRRTDLWSEVQSTITEMAQKDPKSAVRAEALSFIAKEFYNDETKAIMEKSITTDQSWSVVGAGLNSLEREDSERALELAKTFEDEKAAAITINLATLYSKKENATKADFYTKAFNEKRVNGYGYIGFLSSYTSYVSKQNVDVKRASIDNFKNAFDNGGMFAELLMPLSLQRLQSGADADLSSAQTELKEFEENNDAALADQKRREIEKLKLYISELEEFADYTSKQDGPEIQFIQNASEDE